MSPERQCELKFLIRTDTPVPVVESRTPLVKAAGIYDDHYTVAELIQEDLLRYVGRRRRDVFVRPLARFRIFVNDIKQLQPGEMLLLHIGEEGHRDLKEWSRD